MDDGANMSGQRPRVLMLTHRVPYPPDRGDRIRSYNLARLLARHFTLDIASTSDEPTPEADCNVMRQLADRFAVQRISWLVGRTRGALALCAGDAITPASFYRKHLAQTIRQWHAEKPFDAVLTFCSGMVLYSRELIEQGGFKGRHVLDLVDVDSVKWQNFASMTNPPMKLAYAAEAKLLREIEAGTYDRFDAVTVVSDAEAQAYRGCVRDDAPLYVVPNGVDQDYFAPQPDVEGTTLLFVGVLNYAPNAQGIAWFIDGVLPGLRRRVPGAHVVIVGKHPTRSIRSLAHREGVELVGQVHDVRDYLRRATAVIAPLRVAMGVQNKVLEAMSSSRAVVCSPGAARGIVAGTGSGGASGVTSGDTPGGTSGGAVDGEHLLIADDPGQWVDQCERVLTDAVTRQQLARNARQLVESNYSWDRCLAPMIDLLRPQ